VNIDSVSCKLLLLISEEYTNSSTDSALLYANQSLVLGKRVTHKSHLSKIYNQIGNIYYFKGNYVLALENYFLSLKLQEELNDKKGIASIYNNIGNIYWTQGKNDNALEYYLKDLTISEQLNDEASAARTLGNIGIIYEAKQDTMRALEYYLRACKISEKVKDMSAVANAKINIGLIYQGKKQFKKAISYFTQSYAISDSMKNANGIALVLLNMGACYIDYNDLVNAEKTLIAAEKASLEIDSKNYLRYVYSFLSDLFYKKNEFKRSTDYHRLYTKIKDELFNQESAGQLTEMQTKYETETKQKQIEIQNLKLNQQQLEINEKQVVIYAVTAGLGLMVLLAFVVYKGYKQKQKANLILERKNITITKQKDEIELQKHVIEEKNKDITDSIQYAKTIQDTILHDINSLMNSFPGLFVFFKPRDIVSGDFYWYEKKQNKHYIVAADCTGHGVPGAFVSMICNNLLNDVIIHKNFNDPGEILSEVNKGVHAAFKKEGSLRNSNDGMDVSLCVLDADNLTLEFAGAMNPALILRNGEVIEIAPDKNSIGGNSQPDFLFNTRKINLEKEDNVYLFSDGFADQFGGEKGKKLMFKNFRNLLVEIAPFNPDEKVQKLDAHLHNWQGVHDRTDDILVVGFTV